MPAEAQHLIGSAGAPSSRIVAAKAFLIVMVDGYDTLMMGFVAPLLTRQWGLHPADIGKLFAIGYLGAIVGAVVMGPLADRIGRKPMLVFALLLAAAATGLCAFVAVPGLLLPLRFVAGLALGGALPAVISLTAEHARPEKRSGTVTLMYIGYPMGAVVGGAVTAALLHAGWPAIFLGTGIACLLAAGVAATLPESLARGVAASRATQPVWREQFAQGRLWPALLLWTGLFSTLLLTYFLVSWTPSIIVAQGGSPKVAALGAVLLNLGGCVGALAMAPVVNRYGPYRPVAALAAGGAIFIALLGQSESLPLVLILLFATGVCALGAQLNFPAMTVLLFPPHVRSTGTGSTVGFGRIGSIVGPLLGGVLIAVGLSWSSLFLVAALPALAAAVAVFAADRLARQGRRG